MGKRNQIHAFLQAQPALEQVLKWWSDKSCCPDVPKKLRKEVKGVNQSLDRLKAVAKSAAFFLGQKPGVDGAAEVSALPSALHPLLWNYAIADEIAIRYQEAQRWTCRRLLIYVALTGAGFWLTRYANLLLPASEGGPLSGISLPALAGGALIAGAGVASFLARGRFKKERSRFLVARTLAETLRVDLAQRLAGTGLDTVGEFSRQHEIAEDANFPNTVLKAALHCAGKPASAVPADGKGLELARKLWLEDQLRFFGEPKEAGSQEPGLGSRKGRVDRELSLHRRAEGRLKAGVVFTFLFLFLSLAMRVLPHWDGFDQGWHHGLAVAGAFSDLFMGLFGLWLAYYHQVAALHAVTAQKYHRARVYLMDALDALKKEPREEERRKIFARAGQLALAETADWGVHQREHAPRTAFR